ncbi:hypothetical protein M422DRAFT_56252 [Sphaerobolus stellatus SS14]|uniref:Uncharacterized protein n=1 Tax=Sphaerobolus stellatus (strain SS14) TaxID=990650 RepID=A0A0C9UI01_SPHS4|nr:hypothetical protein M422DRAFT_56252 [Sphaerobolus stellatus SS14]
MILGQMEVTMMQTFCAAAHLRGFLFSGADTPGLSECVQIFKECFPGNTADTEESQELPEDQDSVEELSELPPGIQEYMKKTLPSKINVLSMGHIRKRTTHLGLVYASCHATIRDSLAMVELDKVTVPVQIQSIFTGFHGSSINPISIGTFISVRAYPPADATINDPYVEFPVWNARLYKKDTSTQELFIPVSAIRSHFSMMHFDEGHVVVIPLDKASLNAIFHPVIYLIKCILIGPCKESLTQQG